jgi:lipopolysaccharide assembly outer membrane protein LptD (OstA)
MAQDKVLLLKAESAQLLEINGESFRKVTGPAKFLHNDTYLLCDTAYWNINTNIIDAMGNVRIIQDRTTLSSNTLQYVVDQDLARFRGDLVQLVDQDKNTLRTKYLDYNTKDSVAVFQDGGAMRDKDGQVIESLYGTYDSKAKLFVFNDQVNMFMDTTFIKTSRLEYRSDLSTAYFGFGTDMWQEDKMLSANDGWYDRTRELFFFRRLHQVQCQIPAPDRGNIPKA